MFLGYFVPGHLGWDAYRIVAVNQKKNSPLAHTTTVILEKFIGLFSCLLLIMISYPFVADNIVQAENIQRIVNYLYILAVLGGICAVAAFFMRSTSAAVIRKLEAKIVQLASRFFKTSIPPDDHSFLLKGIKACYTPQTAWYQFHLGV